MYAGGGDSVLCDGGSAAQEQAQTRRRELQQTPAEAHDRTPAASQHDRQQRPQSLQREASRDNRAHISLNSIGVYTLDFLEEDVL